MDDPKSAALTEWLETDGLGGFAMGTVSGVLTRRYHSLLTAATTPPTGRVTLVNGVDVTVTTPGGEYALSSQAFAPDVIHPDGRERLHSFTHEPWPRWRWRTEDGCQVELELFMVHGQPLTVLIWRLLSPTMPVGLMVRPFVSGRDYHGLQRENGALRFNARADGETVVWRTYADQPAVHMRTNGNFVADFDWYRTFRYEYEARRGLDYIEDLAAMGTLTWDLSRGEAVMVLAAAPSEDSVVFPAGSGAVDLARELRVREELRRRRFASALHRAADAYLVERGEGKTILAGYPWFTDWGRDSFIALRGLTLATGRFEDAGQILAEWAGAVDRGMLPNRFPDGDGQPEYNSVDASLWYAVAVDAYLRAMESTGRRVSPERRELLEAAVLAILEGYAAGTRYGIGQAEDGLIAAGEPGVQLTWMDAKIGDWVVTPRIGKPVEIQALWINALRLGERLDRKWHAVRARAERSFGERFWNGQTGCLFDVVDVNGELGRNDGAIRPNQLLAVGGLPHAVLEGERARGVVEVCERELWTPLGPRSLATGHPDYRPIFTGGPRERDSAYHQGTVWPWLADPFIEAWLRVNGATPENAGAARERFLGPLREHLGTFGLGHIAEVASGDAPHEPGGCPFQAWSLAALLRIEHMVLRDAERSGRN